MALPRNPGRGAAHSYRPGARWWAAPRSAAGRVLEACLAHTPPNTADNTLSIPAAFWSVQPAPPGPEGEEQLLLRGAVLVRIRGRRAVDHGCPEDGQSEPGSGPPPLSPELVAALEEPPSQPGRMLLRLTRCRRSADPGHPGDARLWHRSAPAGAGYYWGCPARRAPARSAPPYGVSGENPRLGDRYFHSRLTSDMAERSHSLHRYDFCQSWVGSCSW